MRALGDYQGLLCCHIQRIITIARLARAVICRADIASAVGTGFADTGAGSNEVGKTLDA